MRFTFAFLAQGLACLAAPALSQVDERALESCAARASSFIAIEKCLPDEHVGIVMLDAIARDRFFGKSGEALALKCVELNGEKHGYAGAWSCTSNAIDAAIRLGKKLPEGAVVDDPLFQGLNKPDRQDRLKEAELAARDMFPEKTFWGGTLYRPLQ